MNCALLKATCTQMAMQALAVIERLVEFNGVCGRSDVVLVSVFETAKFVMQCAVNGVIGVAGVAGMVAWYTGILKVGRRQIRRIIHVKTFAVGLHHVTGETKAGLLGTLYVFGHTEQSHSHRQD